MDREQTGDRHLWHRLRQMFLTGLAITLPLIITLWLLLLLFKLVHSVSTPIMIGVLRIIAPGFAGNPVFADYLAPVFGFFLTLLLVVLVGGLTTNLLGRRVVEAFDRLMMRLPIIRGIYGGARQLLNAFYRKPTSFRRVVAVEYPRQGIYTVGFVTHDDVRLKSAGRGVMSGSSFVFLPTSPNPTSGWLVLIPNDQMITLDMSIEDGFKLILSGGLVIPGSWEPD